MSGLDPAQAKTHVLITTAERTTRVPKIPVDALEALGLRRSQLPVLAVPLPPTIGVDGLLGLDFLRDNRLTIDFRKGRIDLR